MEGVQVVTMKKLTVLGVGSAGCRIIGLLNKLPGAEHLQLLGFDCDAQSLKNTGLPEEALLLAGEKWRQGKGCGGKVNEGKSAAAAERETLAKLLEDSRMLVVVSALGGGFGSGAMSVIQSVVSKLKLPTLFLLNTPFLFEGASRRKLAEQTIAVDLLPLAGAVVTVPNDLLFCTLDPSVPHEEAFALADKVMAEAARALAVTLCSGNYLTADYDTLSALLNRQHARCSIGFASVAADEEDKERKLIENLLDSPMLGGSSKLKQADAVLLMLNGGSGLSLGDARTVFESLQKYTSPECDLFVGAGSDPSWGSEMQLIAVTVKFEGEQPENGHAEEVLAATHRKTRRKKSESADEFQPDLFTAQTHELGVMEGTAPVIVDGVNLDVPTFLRKNLIVDPGN